MTRLTAATVLRQPSTGQLVFLDKGTELPDWAASMVGEHLLNTRSVTAEPASGGGDTEGEGGEDGPDLFDPGEHKVEEVITYLSGVRATDESPDAPAAELARVTAAEKAGKNRTTLVDKLEQAHVGTPGS